MKRTFYYLKNFTGSEVTCIYLYFQMSNPLNEYLKISIFWYKQDSIEAGSIHFVLWVN